MSNCHQIFIFQRTKNLASSISHRYWLGNTATQVKCLPRGKKHIVNLTEDDLQKIDHVLNDGNASATKRNRALVLLRSSQRMPTQQIASEVGLGECQVCRVRRQFLDEGIDAVLAAERGGNRPNGIQRTISPEIANEASALHEDGMSFRALARKYQFSHEALRKAIHRKSDDGPCR